VKRIAIASAKGGTGKTTTAVGLAHAMSLSGLRVLLVDCDPRRHAALQFGLPPDAGLAGLLQGGEANATEVRPQLWLVDSGGDALLQLEPALVTTPARECLWTRALRSMTELDVVVFDCPPAPAAVQLHTVFVADLVVIPVASDRFSLDGCQTLLRSLEHAWGDDLRQKLLAVLPTFYDPASESTRWFDKELQPWRATQVLQTRIRSADALRCAAARQRTIFDDAPQSPAALDHVCLAEEMRTLVS
jgi:chromosome partitioning protein